MTIRLRLRIGSFKRRFAMTDYQKLLAILQDIGIPISTLDNCMISFDSCDEYHDFIISFNEDGNYDHCGIL